MPLETSYFVSCDKCRNYSSYLPVASYLEALAHLRSLDWYYQEFQVVTYANDNKLYALCTDCKGGAGEHRQGERGEL